MSTGKFKGSMGVEQLMASYGGAWQGGGLGVASSERDLSQTVFSPGRGTTVAEFLQAVPKVKGRPLQATGSNAIPTLQVSVQRADASITAMPLYDASTPVPSGVTDLGTAETFTLARLGLKIAAMKVDAAAAPLNAARNPVEPRVRMATADLLRNLNTLLAVGDVGAPDFKSLNQLATDHLTRIDVTLFASPAQAAARALPMVCPTGNGAGEGPHCLVGNDDMLAALMRSAVASSDCGWRRDARTGLFVYHYQGVPFYRAPLLTTVVEDPPATVSPLFAINLGATGLALVHAYGTAESLGLQVDEEPTQTTTATQGLLVHGAWSLVAWEPEAFFVCQNVNVL